MSTVLSREQDEENTAKTRHGPGTGWDPSLHLGIWTCISTHRAVGQKSNGASFQILPATLDKRASSHWLNDIKRRGGEGARVTK